MKKLLCILLCLLLAAVCAACAGEGQSTDTATDSQEPTEEFEHPVSSSWFDDAVFVGDSITLKLSYYCEDVPSALGNAEFYCAGSLGYANALWDIDDPEAVHPYYRGDVALTEYCAENTGSSKVFILLGMNDIGLYGVDGTADACRELITRIKSHTPNVRFYLQSATPMLADFQDEVLNNKNIDRFNEWLRQFCEENGYRYLDVNSIMRDEKGDLRPEYCSDPEAMGIHFTNEACAMWVDYLKNHV